MGSGLLFQRRILICTMKIFHQRSILFRLSLALFVVLVLVGISYVAITAFAARNYFLETTQKLNANVAYHLVEEVPPFKNGQVNEEALGTIMHSMMAVNPALEVYLLDTAGKIVSFVVLDKKVKLKSVDTTPIKNFISQKGNLFIQGDDPRNPGEKVVFSAAPIVEEGKALGFVYIVLQSEEYQYLTGSLLNSYFLRVGTVGFGIALLVAFALGFILILLLTKGIRKIQSSVQLFGEGNYTTRIDIKGNDEMAQLAGTINTMANTILQNITDLKQIDGLRRELIANVSHDLRSPLTVIHGYVETYLMKKDSLTEEEQKKYLEAILVNSERLTKLVADLFELSKLEAKQVAATIEPMALNEMLIDLTKQFSLLAAQKKVEIKIDVPDKMPLISADTSLLSRAIHNLLDNAMKYTNSGGTVEMKTEIENAHVVVSLKNTGEGIDSTDLPHVFDRYYKAASQKPQHSTGLGLAIARHIILLHGGEITVSSIKGIETDFRIRLPFA